ncbi:MAG: flavodoxin, partial [Dysgonamonadaceae bacterium]|nr:flavodoxin [Dysgonamonadaceae bacterium]
PLIEQASREKDERARPEIKTKIENPSEYDIIFIGYPNWWGDLPMPLYTFLEEYDFSGKTIIPFNTHGGSGLSSTVSAIADIQKGATVVQGFTVSRNNVGSARENVRNWLKEIGFEIKQ